MRVVTRMWSIMDKTTQVMLILSLWVRSRPLEELFVGVNEVARRSQGVCINLARKTRQSERSTRSRFLKDEIRYIIIKRLLYLIDRATIT